MIKPNSLPVVHRLAILYLVLPVLVWLVGWFHWWIGIPAALLVVLALSRPMLPSWKMSSWKVSFTPTTGALLLIALAWVLATAAGGVFDINNYNWDRNRAVLLDLSRHDWPVYFTTYFELPLLLRYYLAYFMVPGLIGKWFGVTALSWAVPLWTWCGAALALLLFTRGYRGWLVLAAVPLLIFFGMAEDPVLNWNVLQIHSALWHFSNSPQHFISGVLYTLLLISLRRHPQFLPVSGVVIATSVLWSPFIAIGLLPLVGVMILQNGIRPFLRWQNLLVAPPLALLLMGYLSAASAQYPRGWIWEEYGWDSVVEVGKLGSVAVYLTLALLILLLRPHLRRDPLFLICLVAFPASFWYSFGFQNDWGKHAPLPAFVVLCFYAATTVAPGWGDYREWYRRSAFATVVLMILAVSILGTLSYWSSVFDHRDLHIFRYERIERHDSLFTAVRPPIQGQHVIHATAWHQLLLRDDGPDSYPDKGQLIIDSDYAVYLKDKRLVYIQHNCSLEEALTRFILHVIPVDKTIIEGNEHDNKDFYFGWNGMRIVDTCIVVRDLPAYDIASFTTGQYKGGHSPTGLRWAATYHIRPE